METKPKRTSPRRILEILEAVCTDAQNATPTNLSQALDIPVPTTYRLLDTMVEEGFIAAGPGGKFIPGSRLRALVLNSLQFEPEITARRAILRRLSDELGETVSLSIPQGTKLIYFDRVESHWPFQVNLKIGDALPLHCCASGKLYLSSLGTEQALQVLKNIRPSKLARNTIIDDEAMSSELEQIAAQRYSLDNEEWFDDMVGAAVPIVTRQGVLCACLSTHAMVARKPLSKIEEQVPVMQATARELETIFFAAR